MTFDGIQTQLDVVAPKSNPKLKSFLSLFSYKKAMQSLEITEGHVAKLVPHRIFSMAFHPAKYKTLVLAGDKWGNLGIWDVVRNWFYV